MPITHSNLLPSRSVGDRIEFRHPCAHVHDNDWRCTGTISQVFSTGPDGYYEVVRDKDGYCYTLGETWDSIKQIQKKAK